MVKYFLGISMLLVTLLSSCTEEFDQTLLYGDWQADLFLESEQEKEMDISNMGFTFNAHGVFTYQSNLKYKEAGNYRIERSVLYSTDTLSSQKIEKAVRITYITADSLHLLMNNGGIEQKIILHKLK
ncbi:MAG: hypothetical protein ACI8P3_000789 [Saprospiraceae bacterium]|jgi:hypothetical protein